MLLIEHGPFSTHVTKRLAREQKREELEIRAPQAIVSTARSPVDVLSKQGAWGSSELDEERTNLTRRRMGSVNIAGWSYGRMDASRGGVDHAVDVGDAQYVHAVRQRLPRGVYRSRGRAVAHGAAQRRDQPGQHVVRPHGVQSSAGG